MTSNYKYRYIITYIGNLSLLISGVARTLFMSPKQNGCGASCAN